MFGLPTRKAAANTKEGVYRYQIRCRNPQNE
jgi:hypothetical protein